MGLGNDCDSTSEINTAEEKSDAGCVKVVIDSLASAFPVAVIVDDEDATGDHSGKQMQ